MIATRATYGDAKRAFQSGSAVLVSEYGHELTRPVSRDTTVHTRDSITWDKLRAQVNMWRGRYPGQRYYIVGEA